MFSILLQETLALLVRKMMYAKLFVDAFVTRNSKLVHEIREHFITIWKVVLLTFSLKFSFAVAMTKGLSDVYTRLVVGRVERFGLVVHFILIQSLSFLHQFLPFFANYHKFIPIFYLWNFKFKLPHFSIFPLVLPVQ
ncbi:unnamed protein product [Citrullus colocynthis]|uniref:Uncharacterized protein n=1 Tax=Citrullus colocynthis TaxID=252529 RepID=A0ABP0Z948_9ROSI